MRVDTRYVAMIVAAATPLMLTPLMPPRYSTPLMPLRHDYSPLRAARCCLLIFPSLLMPLQDFVDIITPRYY